MISGDAQASSLLVGALARLGCTRIGSPGFFGVQTPLNDVPAGVSAGHLRAKVAELSRLVLRGASTLEIVESMRITRYTVQDHLKAVFDKVGVRTRRELAAALLGQAAASRP